MVGLQDDDGREKACEGARAFQPQLAPLGTSGGLSVVAGLPLTNKYSVSILQVSASIRITTVYGGYSSI